MLITKAIRRLSLPVLSHFPCMKKIHTKNVFHLFSLTSASRHTPNDVYVQRQPVLACKNVPHLVWSAKPYHLELMIGDNYIYGILSEKNQNAPSRKHQPIRILPSTCLSGFFFTRYRSISSFSLLRHKRVRRKQPKKRVFFSVCWQYRHLCKFLNYPWIKKMLFFFFAIESTRLQAVRIFYALVLRLKIDSKKKNSFLYFLDRLMHET